MSAAQGGGVALELCFRHISSPSVKPLMSLLPDACVHAKSLQSGLTLCNLMGCNPAGSSVHGILRSRTLEWVCHSLLQGLFLTQGSNPGLLHRRQILYRLSPQGKKERKKDAQLCPTLCDPMDCSLPGSSVHGIASICPKDSSGACCSSVPLRHQFNKTLKVDPFETVLAEIFPNSQIQPK